MLDIAVFSFLLLFLTASYYSVPDKDKETMLESLALSFKNYANDKDSIYKCVVFLLLFYCGIYLFRIPMNSETKPAFISWTEFGAWTLFLIIVFVKFFNDVFGFSMIDIIYSFFDWSGLPDNSGVDNSVQVAQVGSNNNDEDEICDDDELIDEEDVPYIPLKDNSSKKTNPILTPNPNPIPNPILTPNPSIFNSILNNFMPTLASVYNFNSITTTNMPNTKVPNINVPTTNIPTTNTPTTNIPNTNIPTTNVPTTNKPTTNIPTTNKPTTNVPTTTLSDNITVNTSTTNSLDSNTSTTNKASTTTTNTSGFRNMTESFNTMAPSSNSDSEVFNISGNFTYDDAQVVCAAYGSSLANYDQIENTYNNGGEWCNYGWSDGQHAYFPTQKSTWTKLQQNSDTSIRHKCGRPGINGGYVEDKTKQMGINCYGIKPAPTELDNELLDKQKSVITAKTQQDIELESKIQYWKQLISNGVISVNHYNQSTWSENDTKTPVPVTNVSVELDDEQPSTLQSTINEITTLSSSNSKKSGTKIKNSKIKSRETENNTTTMTPTISKQALGNTTMTPTISQKLIGNTTMNLQQTTTNAMNQSQGLLTTLGPPKMNNPNFNTTITNTIIPANSTKTNNPNFNTTNTIIPANAAKK